MAARLLAARRFRLPAPQRRSMVSAKTTANAVSINGNITASSFTVTSASPATITASTIIDTSATAGGSISFGGSIDGVAAGAQDLTLSANGTGSVTLAGSVGSTVRLGALTITAGAASLNIGPAATQIVASSFTVGGTIPTVLSNSSLLTINTSNAAGGSIFFGGAINGTVAGSQALRLTANGTGSVSLMANVGVSTRLGAFSIGAGSGALSVGSAVTTIAANSFAVLGTSPTILNNSAPVTIDTSIAGGSLSFGGAVDGLVSHGQDLILTSGAGSITLSGAVGGTTPLGALTIATAANVTFSNAIIVSTLTQSAGTGTTTFNGPLTIVSDVNLTGTNFTFQAPILSANNVTIDNTGILTISSAGFMSLGGNFLQSGVGLVQTAGTITTVGGNIEFDSGVTLIGNVFLNTGGSIGNITFLSTVDGAHGLNLTGDNVIFGAAVGGTPLTSLRVTASGTISVTGNQTVSTGPMVYSGPVILTGNTRFLDTGANGITFSALSGNAISGNVNLNLVASGSTLVVDGDIDLSGSGGSVGGQLTTSSLNTSTFTGQILSTGGDNLGGAGGSGGDVSLISTGGSISVHNIHTVGGAGLTGGAGGNISLAPAGSYSGDYPVGLIVLNSDLSSSAAGNLVASAGTGGGTGGAITLSASRSSAAKVATITSSLSGNDITLIGHSITMGAYEVMTGLGNISLTGAELTLGDLVALDNLTLLGGDINLLLHGDETILASNGLLYISPTLHFLSGGTYLQVGSLIPADSDLNAQGLGLTAAAFRPQLLYNSHILNFDTSPKPVPFVATEASKQYAIYLLLIADAQLSDLLPVWGWPWPLPYEMCDRKKFDCASYFERAGLVGQE